MTRTKQANKKNNKQESFETTLWQSADKLRKNMDAAEYKAAMVKRYMRLVSFQYSLKFYKVIS